MKAIYTIFFLLVVDTAFAQADFEPNKTFSVALGYGNQGPVITLDCNVYRFTPIAPFTSGTLRAYFDYGTEAIIFSNQDFAFNGATYNSSASARIYGLGASAAFQYRRLSFEPYAGLRYYSVRFGDQALVDAIGSDHLQRYWHGAAVGPEVDNAYGESTTIDIGGCIGFHPSKTIELGALLGLSPVTFDSGATLFGKYWGESPYPNDYYIHFHLLRLEGRIRFNF